MGSSSSAGFPSRRRRCPSQAARRRLTAITLAAMSTVDSSCTLDAPLPAELAGRHQGWFTRYRRWPVFSGPWMRQRWPRVALVALIVYALLFAPPVLFGRPPGTPVPAGTLLQIALELLLPLTLGPWLAWQVRRRGWPAAREQRGLLAAIGLAVACTLGFSVLGGEPLKQWIAERQGLVDASGRRQPVILALGVSVTLPGQPARDLTEAGARSPESVTVRLALTAMIAFWLAGGAALWTWRREREGLAALARERELASAQAARREAELRLSVLAAQVEPHFLFNTLAGVRSAIATDPARASEMIDRLVDYLRAAIPRLRSDGHVQATLGAQLDIVRAYLGLMATRMPRLQWQLQVGDDLLAAQFPPLMLISLAENAVKHGVERKIGPARVELVARVDEAGRLAVSVRDDGPGFQPDGGGSGIGLANIRERLAQLYPGEAELQLKARAEGGVEATITLPLETAAPQTGGPTA